MTEELNEEDQQLKNELDMLVERILVRRPLGRRRRPGPMSSPRSVR